MEGWFVHLLELLQVGGIEVDGEYCEGSGNSPVHE